MSFHFIFRTLMTELPQDEAGLKALLTNDASNAEAHGALGLSVLRRVTLTMGMAPTADIESALAHLRDAINLGHRTQEILKSFIKTLGTITSAHKDWNLDGAFLHALQERGLGVIEFLPALAALLNGRKQDQGSVVEAQNLAWHGDHQTLADLLKTGGLQSALSSPTLTSVMKSTTMGSLAIEVLFTFVRRHFLEYAIGPDAIALHPADRAFCYALADQCFLSEYAMQNGSGEELKCEILSETFSANLAEDPNTDPFPAAVLACYKPLSSFSWAEKLTQLYPVADPGGFGAIVQRHIQEPAIEKALAPKIPEVTEISDKTSLAVKQQYEENPYPRWVTQITRPASPFGEAIQTKYSNSDLRHLGQVTRPEILIAGCGTGHQIISSILGYEAWDLTAIDVSRASLAFAQRQMQKFKVPDINFLVCDILDVRRLEKQFDLVECVGVLHHMSDPIKGLHALTDVLRPGGIMSIGLYSALARRFVIDAQAYATERGYEPTTKGIRQFRHELIEAMRNPTATVNGRKAAKLGAALGGLIDFYATSECRDLVFHVQERNFTLREIESAISTLGLQFLGFKFASYTIYKDYSARFPDDPSRTKLSNWITYEEENPDTFINMYNFDVQKLLN